MKEKKKCKKYLILDLNRIIPRYRNYELISFIVRYLDRDYDFDEKM